MSKQSIGTVAFGALMRAHLSATRELNALLVADHGLTLSDYGVLLQLAAAPDRRMRRVDLADRISLTASGITRLLDGLEQSRLVERAACDSDRRVVYAVLTDRGLETVRSAAETHVAQVESLLGARLQDDELATLAALLEKLSDEPSTDCAPFDED